MPLYQHNSAHTTKTRKNFRCPYCYYRNGNESNNRRHIRKHEDVINGGVDSHWNPFSPLGSVAILKEKLRPLHEIRALLQQFPGSQTAEVAKKRRNSNLASVTDLPDSTT